MEGRIRNMVMEKGGGGGVQVETEKKDPGKEEEASESRGGMSISNRAFRHRLKPS